MKIYPQMVQQSEEWFRVRKGRVTASAADRILTPTGKDSSQWEAYAIELCAECIRPDELPAFIGNMHTDRGNELEAEARTVFLNLTGFEVRTVGFVTRDDEIVGCSPDALVYRDGVPIAGVEIKCPLAKHHCKHVIDDILPKEHAPQVHFSMAVTGLPWYFISYCPGIRPLIVPCRPDAYTEKMRDAVDRFVIYYADLRRRVIPMLLESNITTP